MSLVPGKTRTKKPRRVNNKRELLLDAAERVAVRHGAAHLTLDAVAKEARVGKGGLIYHFPSKKALFQAMLERAVGIYAMSVQAALAKPLNRGNFVQAHIQSLASFGERHEQLSTIIISVAVHYPDLLRPLRRQAMQRYEKMLSQGKSGHLAFAAVMAVNGLFLMECLGVGPLRTKNRQRFINGLSALIEEQIQ